MPSVEPSQNSFPTNLWIFGYGSVIWNHSEIPHLEAIPAYIKGYKRRFWQGSPDHRGTPALPGRVVSLYTPSNLDALNLTALDSSLYPSENAWDVHGLALRVTPSHAEKVNSRHKLFCSTSVYRMSCLNLRFYFSFTATVVVAAVGIYILSLSHARRIKKSAEYI